MQRKTGKDSLNWGDEIPGGKLSGERRVPLPDGFLITEPDTDEGPSCFLQPVIQRLRQ
jgi:hypothetical protein